MRKHGEIERTHGNITYQYGEIALVWKHKHTKVW